MLWRGLFVSRYRKVGVFERIKPDIGQKKRPALHSSGSDQSTVIFEWPNQGKALKKKNKK